MFLQSRLVYLSSAQDVSAQLGALLPGARKLLYASGSAQLGSVKRGSAASLLSAMCFAQVTLHDFSRKWSAQAALFQAAFGQVALCTLLHASALCRLLCASAQAFHLKMPMQF